MVYSTPRREAYITIQYQIMEIIQFEEIIQSRMKRLTEAERCRRVFQPTFWLCIVSTDTTNFKDTITYKLRRSGGRRGLSAMFNEEHKKENQLTS